MFSLQSEHRTWAAFVLAMIVNNYKSGQVYIHHLTSIK